jgi:hypothetical protein
MADAPVVRSSQMIVTIQAEQQALAQVHTLAMTMSGKFACTAYTLTSAHLICRRA